MHDNASNGDYSCISSSRILYFTGFSDMVSILVANVYVFNNLNE